MTASVTNLPKVDAEEILEGILRWVEVETPTHDAGAVNTLAGMVEADMRALGAGIERVPGRDGYGDTLIARTPWGGEGPGILVVSHLDTVHPHGTKEENPIRREGDAVFGPGIYDMKGGAYLGYYAYRHLVRSGRTTPLPVTFLYVPEEEVGSPTSREIIEREGRRAKYVLVTEPARDGGKIVTARKGVARFDVKVTGRPAHAGAQHQDGRSAIRSAARLVLEVEGMTDYARGVTTCVGQIEGGTAENVVPEHCRFSIDMRVPTAAIGEEMCARIAGLTVPDPDVTVEVTGGMNRPPYEMSEAVRSLFDHAKGLAADIGFELEYTPLTGGGSDGNFTAALGVPTLDGLGVDGKGAHTKHEQLRFSSLEPRAKLMIRLLETLR